MWILAFTVYIQKSLDKPAWCHMASAPFTMVCWNLFCSSILLQRVCQGCLIFNSILCHISLLLIWQELSSLIKSSAFQCGAKLSKPCRSWMQWILCFYFWDKTLPQMKSDRLSRWWYTCIRQWRELAFHPDWNEQDLRVSLPLISKTGKKVSWTFLFRIPHMHPKGHRWFG